MIPDQDDWRCDNPDCRCGEAETEDEFWEKWDAEAYEGRAGEGAQAF